MEFLAFDNYDSISIKPSKFCLQCGSQSPDCFMRHLSTTPYNPLPASPVFNSLHSLSQTSYISPISFTTPTSSANSSAELRTQVENNDPRRQSHAPQSTRLESPCTCLREALMVSEQLHFHQQTIANLPFDQTLSTAQLAVRICEKYRRCKDCAKSLNSILCLNALQQTSACYRYLATSKSADEGEGRVFQCRLGSFSAAATLQEDVWKAILGGEVGKAVRAVGELEGWLKEGGNGGKGKERGIDEVTASYHQALIGGVARELEETASLLMMHGYR